MLRGPFVHLAPDSFVQLCGEVAVSRWSLCVYPCDLEGRARLRDIASARAARRYVVCGVNVVLKGVYFLENDPYTVFHTLCVIRL